MTRRPRAAAALLSAAGVVAGGCLVAVWNPFDLVALHASARLRLWGWAVAWLLLAAGVVLYRPRPRVTVAIAVVALPVCYVTSFELLFADPPGGEVHREWAARDGRVVRLVHTTYWFDTVWEVRLRSGSGLLTRDELLWDGNVDDEAPAVELVAPGAVEIVDAEGRTYAVTF